jgi:ribonuclease P protein component
VFVKRISGSAVQRNKIKRWIREIYRKNKCEVSGIYDIIIISGKPYAEIIFSEIETETKDLLKRIK